MYGITIEREFCAAHALRFPNGTEEELHGHNWHVVVEVRRDELDQVGLVVDFHDLEGCLDGILGEFHNRNLNAHPHFREVNPSAELVARYIFDRVNEAVTLAPAVLQRVTVSEAPGCCASYQRS